MRERFCFCGSAISGNRYLFCSFRHMTLATKAAHYGIDGAQYLGLLRDHGEACALCDRPFLPEVLQSVIDHDHSTGRVRGLLCQGCNLRLGFLERALREDRDSALLLYGDFALRALPYLGIETAGST
jgi:Recombination endonuclease VII